MTLPRIPKATKSRAAIGIYAMTLPVNPKPYTSAAARAKLPALAPELRGLSAVPVEEAESVLGVPGHAESVDDSANEGVVWVHGHGPRPSSHPMILILLSSFMANLPKVPQKPNSSSSSPTTPSDSSPGRSFDPRLILANIPTSRGRAR
ncbi:hypothetical protein NL676_039627 [Syzygium grande]|nr:hypothetical protein NL676_039627 [Syzygium grande]